jgi:hypothetical protein
VATKRYTAIGGGRDLIFLPLNGGTGAVVGDMGRRKRKDRGHPARTCGGAAGV